MEEPRPQFRTWLHDLFLDGRAQSLSTRVLIGYNELIILVPLTFIIVTYTLFWTLSLQPCSKCLEIHHDHLRYHIPERKVSQWAQQSFNFIPSLGTSTPSGSARLFWGLSRWYHYREAYTIWMVTALYSTVFSMSTAGPRLGIYMCVTPVFLSTHFLFVVDG